MSSRENTSNPHDTTIITYFFSPVKRFGLKI